jgi:hypothetical protein
MRLWLTPHGHEAPQAAGKERPRWWWGRGGGSGLIRCRVPVLLSACLALITVQCGFITFRPPRGAVPDPAFTPYPLQSPPAEHDVPPALPQPPDDLYSPLYKPRVTQRPVMELREEHAPACPTRDPAISQRVEPEVLLHRARAILPWW